jgi:aspartokinase
MRDAAAASHFGTTFRCIGRLGMLEIHSARKRLEKLAVIKIGGSILTSAEAYRRAAIFVRNRHRASPEERLVVVVSAQVGATDALERSARRIANPPNPAALDLLWSTGELRSVALLALHLEALGISAAALNIHEAGLQSPDGRDGEDRLLLNPTRLRRALAQHPVAIVPGFLAIDADGAVVSLGRGGSDLTAVLLAEGLRACRCELIKDVPGYFSGDPHRDSAARHLPHLTFEQALALADDGCDLVQRKAIEAAARCNLPLVIRSLDEAAPISRITLAQTEAAWTEPIAFPASAP